jgi:hypothetical protein
MGTDLYFVNLGDIINNNFPSSFLNLIQNNLLNHYRIQFCK